MSKQSCSAYNLCIIPQFIPNTWSHKLNALLIEVVFFSK